MLDTSLEGAPAETRHCRTLVSPLNPPERYVAYIFSCRFGECS